MTSPQRFEADVRAWAEKAQGMTGAFVRQTVMRMGEYIVVGNKGGFPGTPVDTGFARASWWVSIDGADATTPLAVEGMDDEGIGGQVVSDITIALTGIDPGHVFALHNNAKYILKLEYGSSKQATGGMVRPVQAGADAIMAEVAGELGLR